MRTHIFKVRKVGRFWSVRKYISVEGFIQDIQPLSKQMKYVETPKEKKTFGFQALKHKYSGPNYLPVVFDRNERAPSFIYQIIYEFKKPDSPSKVWPKLFCPDGTGRYNNEMSGNWMPVHWVDELTPLQVKELKSM